MFSGDWSRLSREQAAALQAVRAEEAASSVEICSEERQSTERTTEMSAVNQPSLTRIKDAETVTMMRILPRISAACKSTKC